MRATVFISIFMISLLTGTSCPSSEVGIDWGDDSDMANLPVEDGVFSTTYYIDPVGGSNSNNGTSEDTAFQNLDALDSIFPPADSRILVKRGTVLRLNKSFKIKGGTSSGWVTYGAYGTGVKPIVLGSEAITLWTSLGDGLYQYDWSSHIDMADGRTEFGVEQGPGNLWFFSATNTMIGWGWRKQVDISAGSVNGDWYYNPSSQIIRLKWNGTLPAVTEAGINRRMIDFSGQNYFVVEDWDFRYGGEYVIRGHQSIHLRFRRLDMSFCGGGTKIGEYVRLGNGIETNGNVRDVEVTDCRFHQIFDTGFDPQNTGTSPVSQRMLTYKNNIVSYAGLSSFELWLRPADSKLYRVMVENNTFIHCGRGWGYEQHDHAGQAKIGADLVIFENHALINEITVQKNVFHNSRIFIMSEYRDHQAQTKALIQGITFDKNLYSPGSTATGFVLFNGTVQSDGTPVLGASIVYADLNAWKNSILVTGKDGTSVQAAASFVNPIDYEDQDSSWIFSTPTVAPIQFGPFALQGDYHQTAYPEWGLQ